MRVLWVVLIWVFAGTGSLLSINKAKGDSIVLAIEQEVDAGEAKKPANGFLISAYVQGQYQHGQKDVRRLMVGSTNEHLGEKSFNRIGLRRAFISTMYEQGIIYALVTVEIKDNKEVWFSDAFLNITDPWTKRFSLAIGSINPDFGYELSISPSNYELIEGTAFIYSLLPDIYDIGAKLTYQAPEKYGNLKVYGSIVAGNGVQQETDSRRDFIGGVTASTAAHRMFRLSGGLSYYHGSVYQGTENVYRMKGKEFILDSRAKNKGGYAKREYVDIHAQLALQSSAGLSQLRGEYIQGVQPAGRDFYDSPNSSKRPEVDTYIRKFTGGSIYYLQQIGPKLPLTFWGGYSWHDPNTKVSGDDIGRHNTNRIDIKYQTASIGLIYYPIPSIRLQAFYEMPFNERSVHLSEEGFSRRRKENVFTFRIQYKY